MIITDEAKLREKCSPVESYDEAQDLIKKLQEVLLWSGKQGNPGVGLACPQIGIPKTLSIVRISDNLCIDLVNPKIISRANPFEFDGEGCLSFPNLFGKTRRFNEVIIENEYVNPLKFVATDFIAIVCQHEIDHLNNILLPDIIME